MASKRARERAEFLVTSNRGVLADIIPAVANALDQAWEDADNRVAAERERWKNKLNSVQAYQQGLWHGAAAERERIARNRLKDAVDSGVKTVDAYLQGREAGIERDRAADKLMTDRAYHRGMTRGMRDGIEHGMLLQRNRLAERLRHVFHAVSAEALKDEASKKMWAQLLETIDLIASKMERGEL